MSTKKTKNNWQLVNKSGGETMEDKLLLTTKECVEYIGIGETTLRNLAKTYDDIPHIFIGTKLYFIKSELNKWLIEHKGEILK